MLYNWMKGLLDAEWCITTLYPQQGVLKGHLWWLDPPMLLFLQSPGPYKYSYNISSSIQLSMDNMSLPGRRTRLVGACAQPFSFSLHIYCMRFRSQIIVIKGCFVVQPLHTIISENIFYSPSATTTASCSCTTLTSPILWRPSPCMNVVFPFY